MLWIVLMISAHAQASATRHRQCGSMEPVVLDQAEPTVALIYAVLV